MILKRPPLLSIYFSVFSLVVLYLGYSLNFWGAQPEHQAGPDYSIRKTYDTLKTDDPNNGSIEADVSALQNILEDFPTFDRFSESLIPGRLAKSRRDGLLSSGGFTGNFIEIPNLPVPENYWDDTPGLSLYQLYQYRIYLDGSLDNRVGEFQTYRSHPGGQAFFLGVLDKIIPGTNTFKLGFYYNSMALLTTLAIFLIIFWFYKELGIITGLLMVISFAIFSYPTLYARSLWWVIWAFYIPFILILFSHYKEDVSCRKLSLRTIFLLGFVGMSFKVFLNGFEFISATVLMTMTPIVYYAVKKEWRFVDFINRLFAVGGGIFLSILTFFVILSLQYVLAGNTFSDGMDHIYHSFIKRTHNAEYGESISQYKLVYEVTRFYILNSPALEFVNMGIELRIGVKFFLLLSAILSAIWIFLFRGRKYMTGRRIISALIAALWFSVLAPLSWFIIFTQHSLIHTTQDPFVWFMPCMFYCVGLMGITAEIVLASFLGFFNHAYLERFVN